MNIGIDIMGGDFAPDEIIKGVILAKKTCINDANLYLFGLESLIRAKLIENNSNPDDYFIVNCSDTLEMGDDPVKSFAEKQDSGMVKGFEYLKNGTIDGFASAGNTGAMMVGATKIIGVIDGILRPCISSYYPNNNNEKNLVLDVGLNADAKPENILQYGILGDLYAKHIMGIENPKIGLLNIGQEKSKGNVNAKSSYLLLENEKNLNFIGNIEGGDLYKANYVDVIVTDGFTGNIVLKQAESFYNILAERNITDSYFDNYNYENYGGTPVLGINKTVVVGHGKSNSIAIKNMIILTGEIIKSQFTEKIIKAFDYGTN
ncbi:MAG: phosphate--acyl-ACP acyltransferase [Bacteroidales bacterium]|nr:phosphate--acyl-ACP acyltransferase [Bacteroidales bacterium]MDD3858682.1 phosphate--acyl-ACP acyltransferase [Bacteroidales bacterium]